MKKKLASVILILAIVILIVVLAIFINNKLSEPVILIFKNVYSSVKGASPAVMSEYVKIDRDGTQYEGYYRNYMEKVKTLDSETMKILKEKVDLLYNELKNISKDKNEEYVNGIVIHGKTYTYEMFNEKAQSIYKEILDLME
mgnify:CR=1 FL=1